MDVVRMMKMLIDTDMEMFDGLNIKVVFLQNIVTDLLLGLDCKGAIRRILRACAQKYGAMPGFITQNMPFLRNKLVEWGITEVVICSSINKIGYLMSPCVAAYEWRSG